MDARTTRPRVSGPDPRRRRGPLRVLLALWPWLLSLLVLGPALAPGFVLSRDMVWVPDLAVRADGWGAGSGLPRAVPSDAVVALIDEILPGMLLQKLVLVLALGLGAVGARRLVAHRGAVAELVATTLWVWNPFVAERLVIGHWPVLLGYAVLPWLLLGTTRWRRDDEVAWWLPVALVVGSLSAGAGSVSAVAVLTVWVTTRTGAAGRWRAPLAVLALGAANAPWVVAGVLHAASATSDPAAASAFALHDSGPLPGPVAALGLGGIWNAQVVPGSVLGAGAWVWVALLAVATLVGGLILRRDRRNGPVRTSALAACWSVGWGLAVLTWLLPGVTAWLAVHVPGGGLLRDGARALALCAPALVVLVATGAASLADALARRGGELARLGVAAAVVLVPLAVLPDLALGVGGHLRAVSYPTSLLAARDVVVRAREGIGPGSQGDILVLPLSSYRAPAWNRGRPVLDPLPRLLPPDPVASDVLVVDGRRLAGEDPRVRAASLALGRADPRGRARALQALGVGLVVTDTTAGGAPEVPGRVLLEGPVRVVGLSDVVPRPVPLSWTVTLAAAWAAYAALLVLGLALGVGSLVRTGDARSGARGAGMRERGQGVARVRTKS